MAVAENLAAIVSGRTQASVTGIAGLGDQLAKAGGGAKGMWFFAAFTSYLWPGLWLVQGIIGIDRRRAKRINSAVQPAALRTRLLAFAIDTAILFGRADVPPPPWAAALGARPRAVLASAFTRWPWWC